MLDDHESESLIAGYVSLLMAVCIMVRSAGSTITVLQETFARAIDGGGGAAAFVREMAAHTLKRQRDAGFGGSGGGGGSSSSRGAGPSLPPASNNVNHFFDSSSRFAKPRPGPPAAGHTCFLCGLSGHKAGEPGCSGVPKASAGAPQRGPHHA